MYVSYIHFCFQGQIQGKLFQLMFPIYMERHGNPIYTEFPSVNLRQKIRIYARHDQTQIENSKTYLLISLIGIMSPSSGKFWVGSNIIALGVTNKIPEISFL